jgi:hypothetical protein
MKNIIFTFLILVISMFADTINKNSFVGQWSLQKTMNIEKNVILDIQGRTKYLENEQFHSFTNIIIYYEHDMSKYNTSNIKFKNTNLVITSYTLITSGNWKVDDKKLTEDTVQINMVKNKAINAIGIKDMPIDEETADMMMLMMKKLTERDGKEILNIINISENEIILISNDEDKIELILKRIK